MSERRPDLEALEPQALFDRAMEAINGEAYNPQEADAVTAEFRRRAMRSRLVRELGPLTEEALQRLMEDPTE